MKKVFLSLELLLGKKIINKHYNIELRKRWFHKGYEVQLLDEVDYRVHLDYFDNLKSALKYIKDFKGL